MEAKLAHQTTVDALLQNEVVKELFSEVEAAAKLGKFNVTVNKHLSPTELQGVETTFKHFGYTFTTILGHGISQITIRW